VGTGMPVKVLAELRRRLDPLYQDSLIMTDRPNRGWRWR